MRQRELVVGQIDGDDPARTGADRADERSEADAAQADHRDRLAGGDLGRVDHGADPGEYGAAEQRRLVEWQLRINFDQRTPRHRREFGEGGAAEMMMDRLPVARQTPPAGKQRAGGVGGGARLAQGGTTLGARQAVAATGHEHHHHVLALFQIGDARAQCFDDAGGLVPQEHRRRSRPVGVDHRQIGMTQPFGLKATADVMISGRSSRWRGCRAGALRPPAASRGVRYPVASNAHSIFADLTTHAHRTRHRNHRARHAHDQHRPRAFRIGG